MMVFTEVVFVFGVAVLTALLVMAFLNNPWARSVAKSEPAFDPLSLLFDDGVLHHGTYAALRRFGLFPGTHVWDDLRHALLPRFPEFPDTAGICASGSMRVLPSNASDPEIVEVRWRDGLCWVHISEDRKQDRQGPRSFNDNAAVRCVETLPHPLWETDQDDKVVWNNEAYDAVTGSNPATAARLSVDPSKQSGPQRVSLSNDQDETEWYEICTRQTRAGRMHTATCITPLVSAEEAQRTFFQTLAKTFAHLSIGLAIFDRKGQLGIFNPALVDLTGLQAQFLAARPTMMSFFDALRENRMMPEPKNYKTWRQDIADVILAASGGQYRETWTLEDGRTYAVQGRPHPDGATAFLIEDISAEVTLSRSFRADVEQFETILDSIDDAVVVFSSAGILTFCNDAYRTMWGQNPEAAFADVTLADAVALWEKRSKISNACSAVSEFAATMGNRATKSFTVPLKDGAVLQCTLFSLAADATLIRFSQAASDAQNNAPDALSLTD